jgi:hypothetical protein
MLGVTGKPLWASGAIRHIKGVFNPREPDRGVLQSAKLLTECQVLRAERRTRKSERPPLRAGLPRNTLCVVGAVTALRAQTGATRMTDAERDKRLRNLLSVPQDATALDILKLVAEEGWTRHPYSDQVEGQTLYFCPASQGIWISVERDNATGRTGQTGWPTPELASLEALRKTRGVDPLSE